MSIRDDLAAAIHENFNACRGRNGVSPEALADAILASPVIRRIQAEALRGAAEAFRDHRESGAPIGTPAERWLLARADRTEKGSADV